MLLPQPLLAALAPRELALRRCRPAACILLGRCTCGCPPLAGLPTCGLQVQGDDALLLHEELFFVLLVPCSATSVSSANSFCAAHSGELRSGQSATLPCTTGMSAF